MAEKDTLYSEKIKHKGIFDFKGLYSYAYDYLNSEGYDIMETKYSEEITGDSKEIKIEWEAEKKISDYFKFSIKMGWKFLGLKKIKIKKEGKEIDTNSGVAEIKFKAILIKDYENRWEDAPIWKFLRGVYDRYLIRSRIDEYETKIITELNDFIDQIKSFLVLEGKK